MLGLFKFKNPCEDGVVLVYTQALQRAVSQVFYTEYAVPDTFTGRFDCLLLHIFMVMERMIEGGQMKFNQALFDVTFANMDQSLRELGIGDVGIPKHQKKMMKAFNGRMHAYRDAFQAGDMAEVLRKNLYGGADIDAKTLKALEKYVRKSIKHLQGQEIDDIISGKIEFLD